MADWAQVCPAQPHLAAGQEIYRQYDGRKNLRGDGRNSRALNAPAKNEYVDGIENRVERASDHHAVHGQARISICAGHV